MKRMTLRERAERCVAMWPNVKRENSYALRELLTDAWLAGFRAARRRKEKGKDE